MPVKLTEEREQVLDFLRKHEIGVLATVDPNGEPNAAAIFFTPDDNLNIAFLTKTGTKKHDNLKRHNKAMLVVYEGPTQTTVQIKGVATEVTDEAEANKIFGEILKVSMESSEEGLMPISKLQAGSYVAYRIETKEVRMAVYIRPDPGDYNSIFQTINP